MLIVLLKKTDYNTRVAAIDTKISTLDGKITKNKNNLEDRSIDIILHSFGNSLFDGGNGFQAYLIFLPAYRYFKTILTIVY